MDIYHLDIKYKPSTFDDLVGNEENISFIINWLHSFSKHKKVNKKSDISRNLIITGNHGIGKSCTIDVILSNLNYSINNININTLSKINIDTLIQTDMKMGHNILDMMNMIERKRYAIVIDELESLSSNNDKTKLFNLLKNNINRPLCPIILISSNKHTKSLSDIKKYATEIKFDKPSDSDLETIGKRIILNENINMESKNILNKIIEHSQNDIRRLKNLLFESKFTFGTQMITERDIEDYCKSSKKKDINFDLFKVTENLIRNYKSINDCYRYYELEKVSLSLMIHENYINAIDHSDLSFIDKMNKVCDISELLSKGDIVENYIYGNQNWSIQHIHGFYTCAITSFLLKDLPNRPLKLNFTVDLNKTSIKKINRKNIINIKKHLDKLDSIDFMYVSLIIQKHLQDDCYKKIIKFANHHDIKPEHIESLLKIDKINPCKLKFVSKIKKKL